MSNDVGECIFLPFDHHSKLSMKTKVNDRSSLSIREEKAKLLRLFCSRVLHEKLNNFLVQFIQSIAQRFHIGVTFFHVEGFQGHFDVVRSITRIINLVEFSSAKIMFLLEKKLNREMFFRCPRDLHRT